MKEDFLHYLWKHGKFDASCARTTSGELVMVLHPGEYLQRSGPDFFNAQLVIGAQRWAGNIEIHIKSSDWYLHNHESDPAYENVILHVVWEHDVEIFRKDNSTLPVLELKPLVSESELSRYRNLFSGRNWIFCEKMLKAVDHLTVTNWLDRVFLERLERKSKPILKLLETLDGDWEAVMFVLLAQGFGLNANGGVFRDAAMSIPFRIVRREAGDALNLEALLFESTGLLNGRIEDQHADELKARYRFLKAKYDLKPSGVPAPEFFKHRPDNFPTIRLAQLAWLYHQKSNLFSKIVAGTTASYFYDLLRTGVSAYWEEHYVFGRSHLKRKKQTTPAFIDLLIINTVVPVRFAYGQYTGRDEGTGLVDLLLTLKPERNAVIARFESIGANCASAFVSQALLELKSSYCDKSRCLECNIGLSLLRPIDSS